MEQAQSDAIKCDKDDNIIGQRIGWIALNKPAITRLLLPLALARYQ